MTFTDFSSSQFENAYTYEGHDLGAVWSPECTRFRLWAPTAQSVLILLYASGDVEIDMVLGAIPMTRDVRGTWIASVSRDLQGIYYTYLVRLGDHWTEACDPYARTTGSNGQRAMIMDLAATDPPGWNEDRDPHAGIEVTSAVIYELHLRDISVHPSSGIRRKGKYLGLAETGTRTPGGSPTGLDHIRDLGVTHIHLMPIFDFGSVDETRPDSDQYNWGYDPVNFNVPEGSYASDSHDGAVRVRELKQMIRSLHREGLSVVMDVVYNHVYDWENFCFNRIVPHYFTRISGGVRSNGSGCGNDTATERSMVRKYIVDSVCYWADEYHIDGFRFDLAGLIDVDTINEVVKAVHLRHPNVLFYGEGWTLPTLPTKDQVTLAVQTNAGKTPDFAYFNDTLRDAIRGSVFVNEAPGFVTGEIGIGETLDNVYRGMAKWCPSPAQTVNYVSCHDNNTLFDRICLAAPGDNFHDLAEMNKLAAVFYLTAQGIPFLAAGEEMLRTKTDSSGSIICNSYCAGDDVNSIKWDTLDDPAYQSTFQYYRGLIAFRQAHPALHFTTYYDILSSVFPIPVEDHHVGAFQIRESLPNGTSQQILVIFSASRFQTEFPLPEGKWTIYANDEKAGAVPLGEAEKVAVVQPLSGMILVKPD